VGDHHGCSLLDGNRLLLAIVENVKGDAAIRGGFGMLCRKGETGVFKIDGMLV